MSEEKYQPDLMVLAAVVAGFRNWWEIENPPPPPIEIEPGKRLRDAKAAAQLVRDQTHHQAGLTASFELTRSELRSHKRYVNMLLGEVEDELGMVEREEKAAEEKCG